MNKEVYKISEINAMPRRYRVIKKPIDGKYYIERTYIKQYSPYWPKFWLYCGSGRSDECDVEIPDPHYWGIGIFDKKFNPKPFRTPDAAEAFLRKKLAGEDEDAIRRRRENEKVVVKELTYES